MSALERLYPMIRLYLDDQSARLSKIAEPHRQPVAELTRWIASRANKPTEVIFVCTGNSRRSVLGATMGNIVAAYRGNSRLKFYSAGTTPSAFNSRTMATLREIGVVIEATGSQAKRGAKQEPNPHYRIQWGSPASSLMVEYSKTLDDVALPHRDFAAVMVCDEADSSCPTVQGAALRLSMTFQDPKAHDGSKDEALQYAKTRELLAQTMLQVIV